MERKGQQQSDMEKVTAMGKMTIAAYITVARNQSHHHNCMWDKRTYNNVDSFVSTFDNSINRQHLIAQFHLTNQSPLIWVESF